MYSWGFFPMSITDDEEEIDVVTVESKQSRVRLVRKPVTITVRADPCPRRFHMSVHRQQHNYAARSPDSEPEPEDEEEDDDEDSEDEPQSKRVCTASTSQPGSPSETPLNSDTEDTDRRRNHNFLERKRRNDLRSRFLALRDQIPGLESAKTPKVAILTHATEYLMDLHATEKRRLQEKKRLKSRQQNLLRRLSELKRSWGANKRAFKVNCLIYRTLLSSYSVTLEKLQFFYNNMPHVNSFGICSYCSGLPTDRLCCPVNLLRGGAVRLLCFVLFIFFLCTEHVVWMNSFFYSCDQDISW